MKGKTSLTLMEQAIMLLVLALVAALCLQAFLWADTRSRDNSIRDRALTQLQSAAEVLKASHGNYMAAAATFGGMGGRGQWTVYWDENWTQTQQPGAYQLSVVSQPVQLDYFGCATLEMLDADGVVLAELQVSWQEEVP